MERILIEKKGKIGLVKMNYPKALNALSTQTLLELNDAIDTLNTDDSIGGIIITGEGKAFVAGADISQMKDYNAEQGRDYAALAQTIFNKIENLNKPIIAAVNGYALGGGCELAMSCDIRIASDNAIFGQPEVNLGVIPCFGGTQRLSRLVGTGIAKELIFTGRFLKASEALNIRLVNKVVTSEQLLNEAETMMNLILEKAPLAIKYSKICINKGFNLDLNSALELEKDIAGLTFATQDKTEGMHAFLEKRKPSFKNN